VLSRLFSYRIDSHRHSFGFGVSFGVSHNTLINLYDEFLRRVIDRVCVVFRRMPGELNNLSIALSPKAVRIRTA